MNRYDYADIISQECQHTTCEYWGQGGCMLPGRCIYSPDEDENTSINIETEENI